MSVSGAEITGIGGASIVQLSAYIAGSYMSLRKLNELVPELNAHHIASRNEAAIRDLTSNGTNAPTNGLRVSPASEPHHGVSAAIPKGTGTQIG